MHLQNDHAVEPFEYYLANGLHVILSPMQTGGTVAIGIAYRCGSRHEQDGYRGGAHLLEHMLFRGSERFSPADNRGYAETIRSIGGSSNANTSQDRTFYHAYLRSEHLGIAIRLEADRMRNATFSQADLRSEMPIVRNELERRDANDFEVLSFASLDESCTTHPYRYPVIGLEHDIETMTATGLREFYDRFYQPNNATLIIAGDFSLSSTQHRIEKHFGRIPRPAMPPSTLGDTVDFTPTETEIRRPSAHRSFLITAQAPAALGQRTILSPSEFQARSNDPVWNEDICALTLVRNMFLESEPIRNLTRTGIAAQCAFYFWTRRDPGFMQFYVSLFPSADIASVRDTLFRELARFADEGPTASELERARVAFRVWDRDSFEGSQARLFMIERMHSSRGWRHQARMQAALAQVSAAHIQDVVRRYILDAPQSTATLIPSETTSPKSAKRPVPSPSRDVAAPAPVTSNRDSVHLLVKRSRARLPVLRHGELANGAEWRFAARPNAQTVALHGVFEAGPWYGGDHPVLSLLTTAMLMRGTERSHRNALRERYMQLGASRSVSVDISAADYDPFQLRLNLGSATEDFQTVLEIFLEELTTPSFAADELASLKTNYANQFTAARRTTQGNAYLRLRREALHEDDPGCIATLEQQLADLERVTIEDIRAFHATHVLSKKLKFTVAGGLSADACCNALEETFGRIPLAARAPRSTKASIREPKEVRVHYEVSGKASSQLLLGRAVTQRRDQPYRLASLLANTILGVNTLASRLGRAVRFEHGLTYDIRSGFKRTAADAAPWAVALTVRPENTEAAIAAVRQVLATYHEHGPTEQELARAKNGYANEIILELDTNLGMVQRLRSIDKQHLDSDWLAVIHDRIDLVTTDLVHEVVRDCFSPENLIIVTAGTSVD